MTAAVQVFKARILPLSWLIAAWLGFASCGTSQDSPVEVDASFDGDTTVPARWSDLYATYFGPSAPSSCTARVNACHAVSTDLGVSTSGFVCGMDAQSCWQGMTHGVGGDAPLVPPGGAADATTTPLWAALYKGGTPNGTQSNNMPQTLAYQFQATDLDKIRSWIQAGAPDD